MLNRLKLLALVMVVFALGLPGGPVAAQDGEELSAAEQVLLDRAVAAMQALADYDSFVVDYTASEDYALAIVQSKTDVAFAATVIPGAVPNLQAAIMLSDDVTTQLFEVTHEVYTLEAGLRLVDGALYLNATRTVSEGDPALMDPVPEGWVQVATGDDYPAFAPLTLDPLLAGDPLAWIMPLPVSARQVLAQPTSVGVAEGTHAGEPVETITLRLERGGVTDDGEAVASLTTVTLTLGANDQLLVYELADRVVMGPQDGSETLSVEIDIAVYAEFSAFDAGATPATVPEELGAPDTTLTPEATGSPES